VAQHDYSIANQTGAQFRTDLNNALEAIVTQNSDEVTLTPPSTPFAYQYYIDTTDGILYQRNSTNSTWISIQKVSTGVPLHAYRESQGTIQTWEADLGTNVRSCSLLSPESDSVSEPFIFFTPNSWRFRVDTVEALSIDSLGKVGIGVTNPSDYKTNADDLVVGDLTSGNGHGITIACGSTNAGRICFADGTDATSEQRGMLVYVNGTTDAIQFHVEGSEVARFDADDFFVGELTGGNSAGGIVKAKGFNTKAGHSGTLQNNTFNISWSGSAASLYIDNSEQGVFSYTSDYRVKQNVESISVNCIDRIKQLRPVQYQIRDYEIFVADGVTREGFIAHEVGEVIPSGCHGEKDAENKIQSLRLDAILSVTVKALQEAVTKIETLETSVAALEARVTALESP
jgi:hypothetical protein